jgi:hypothetical protein
MVQQIGSHVSLLVHFRPSEVRAAAARLATLLESIANVVMKLDAGRGNVELGGVRGVDLRLLTEWLYERGARCVFVRYEHEGRRLALASGDEERLRARDDRPN